MSSYIDASQSSRVSKVKSNEVFGSGIDTVDWSLAPTNWPELVAIRRRREIVIYKPKGRLGLRPPAREAITEFTQTSGGRLRRAIDNHYADFKIMVTLTYGENAPSDGVVCKRHLRALWERFRRNGYFEKGSFIWWMEFQARGALHFHMVGTHWVDREWVAKSWAEITDGDARACTRVEGLRNADVAGSYAAKYAAKKEQKIVPDGFINCGRWWGRVGLKPSCARMPSWVHAWARRREKPVRPVWAPRLAAASSKAHLRAGLKLVNIYSDQCRVYFNDYAVIIRGPESLLSMVWHGFVD